MKSAKFYPAIIFITLLTTAVFLTPYPAAGQDVAPTKPAQTIMLKDGTVLKGHLISVENDKYTIKTENLGIIKINASDLSAITAGPQAGLSNQQGQADPAGQKANPAQGIGMGQVGMIQQKLMGDPSLMSGIQGLMNDPEIVELLQDQTLLQDAMSMDPDKMQNNPKLQKLMQNPKMKALLDEAGQKMFQ